MNPAKGTKPSPLPLIRWLKTASFAALFLSMPLTANALLPVAKPTVRTTTGQPAKAEVVARLRALQVKLTSDIAALENSSKKRLQESTSITLKQNLNVASAKIARLADQIDDIEKKRTELLSRRDFLNQLTLLVDSKWDGQNLQKFLENTLLDMAVTELTSPEGASPTWRFATYLSIAVREIPEGRDDVMGVMESYMTSSSILNPKTPAEFASQRDYTNDTTSVTAHPVPRDRAGDGVDEKLRRLNESLGVQRPAATSAAAEATSKADVELRLNLKQPLPAAPQPSTVETPQPPEHQPKILPPSS